MVIYNKKMTEEQIWINFMKKNMIEEINSTKWSQIKKCHIISLSNGKVFLQIPDCAEELRFSAIFKGGVTNLKIPQSVKQIYFYDFSQVDLTDLIINDKVILHFEKIPKISASTLPRNLKYLIINYLDFPLINLPNSLIRLTVKYGCSNLEKSIIP
jgi:hypothetical protein